MMQAIVQSGYGRPEQVLGSAVVERPEVGEDEVLMRVRATSVNTPDWNDPDRATPEHLRDRRMHRSRHGAFDG